MPDIIKFYQRFFDKKTEEEQVGWLEKHSQELAFIELSQIIPNGYLALSILDVGCGLGALSQFLSNHHPRNIFYTGWDINQHYVTQAKKKGLDVEQKDFLESKEMDKFDYVFGSGLFSYKIGDEKEQYEMLDKAFLRLYQLCRLGVAVNFLSDTTDKDPDFFYYNPCKVIMAARKTCQKFVLNYDFRGDGFSLFLYKNWSRLLPYITKKNKEPEMAWLLRGGFHQYVIEHYPPDEKSSDLENAFYGIALFSDNKLKQAESYLSRSKEPLASYFLGFVKLKQGDKLQAVHHLKLAQKKYEHDEVIKNLIAKIET